MATSAITFPANGTTSLSVKAMQPFTVLLTVTNGATVPVNVVAIQPRIYQGTNVHIPSFSGNPSIPATNMTVPASGTLTFQYTDIVLGPDLANAPAGGTGANDLSGTTFSIDAIVSMSDGTINTSTAATLTVTARVF